MNSKFTKLTSDLDCPNPNCQGWLNVYAKKGDTRPCFLRCANSSKNDNGDCNVSTIFSVKQSTCPACNKPIHKVKYNLLLHYIIIITHITHALLTITIFNRDKFSQLTKNLVHGSMPNAYQMVQPKRK